MKIRRFFKEFFHPELKCKRISHKYIKHNYRIRVRSNEWREVAIDYRATRKECSRCHKKLKMIKKKYITYYTSVSMPESYWEKLDDDGFLIL